jgi:hypothetical protein
MPNVTKMTLTLEVRLVLEGSLFCGLALGDDML